MRNWVSARAFRPGDVAILGGITAFDFGWMLKATAASISWPAPLRGGILERLPPSHLKALSG